MKLDFTKGEDTCDCCGDVVKDIVVFRSFRTNDVALEVCFACLKNAAKSIESIGKGKKNTEETKWRREPPVLKD